MLNNLAIAYFKKAGFTKDVSIIFDDFGKIKTGRVTALKVDHVVIETKQAEAIAVTFGLIDKIVVHD